MHGCPASPATKIRVGKQPRRGSVMSSCLQDNITPPCLYIATWCFGAVSSVINKLQRLVTPPVWIAFLTFLFQFLTEFPSSVVCPACLLLHECRSLGRRQESYSYTPSLEALWGKTVTSLLVRFPGGKLESSLHVNNAAVSKKNAAL